MTPLRIAAVDIGASGGRVMAARFDGESLALEDVHRFQTPLGRDPGSGLQCWGIDEIEAQVREGLRAADAAGPIASVGIDTWGVDFVLLDAGKRRVAPAVSYRDVRTAGAMEQVFAKVPREEVYRRTGVQFASFNTLYQLVATARDHPDWLARARHLLMIPDYLNHRLCGAVANEYTNATTSQLLRVDGSWDLELLARLDLPAGILGPVIAPGTVLGAIPAPTGRAGEVKVVAPGTHDTASAVAAIPLQGPDEAFLSSGTWSLMGIESKVPCVDDAARRLNIANEGGVERRFRVLKNIAGLWLEQRVAAELAVTDHAALAAAAEEAAPWRSLVDPNDARFMNPPSMVDAIRTYCSETGQPEPRDGGELARCVFDSLALSYRLVKEQLESVIGKPIVRVRIVGGGSRNRLLDQLCADACQVPVSAGPVETSALGNVCVQLIALGALRSLEEARALLARTFAPELYRPREPVPDPIWRRFCAEDRRGARR